MGMSSAPPAFEPLAGLPKARVVRFVLVPARRCFAIDGTGAPGGPAFEAAFGVIYPAAYGLHFALKRRGVEAKVGALEGLWGHADGRPFSRIGDVPATPEGWAWTLLVPIPPEASEPELDAALAAARTKSPGPAAEALRIARFDPQRSAEVLHVGPYAAEAPTIEGLHAAVAAAGFRPSGPHHEIYLGDPRRAAPEKLRTVIRQAVVPA